MEAGSRRGALKTLLGAGAATLCATAGAPLVVALGKPPIGSGGERWVRTIKLDSLKEGEPRRVTIVSDVRDAWTAQKDVTLGAVWLVRHGDAVSCLNVTCPHLGCSVSQAESGFYCPCHDSAFGPKGERKTGPSPRDLDALATRVVGGFIEVDFRRYRVGTPERIEIG